MDWLYSNMHNKGCEHCVLQMNNVCSVYCTCLHQSPAGHLLSFDSTYPSRSRRKVYCTSHRCYLHPTLLSEGGGGGGGGGGREEVVGRRRWEVR